jgi:hypothetical protein
MSKRENTSERIWRVRLQRLCQMRFDTHFLPDNDKSRAMLTALLRFGMTDDSAIADAPWSASELPTLKRQGRRLKWRDVGKLIGLTFDEWKAAKLWVAKPVDVSDADLEAWRIQQRKESWRKSKQKARAREAEQRQDSLAKAKPLKPRQSVILKMLIEHGPISVSELTKRASRSNAFKPSRLQDTYWPRCAESTRHGTQNTETTGSQWRGQNIQAAWKIWPGEMGQICRQNELSRCRIKLFGER